MPNTSSSSDASRQTRLLFQVLDKLPVALFAFRPDGKPAFANRAARELFGKKKLVSAGEFVAHFGLKLASDQETYPGDKFPLSQVFLANDNDSVSVDDVLLPDSQQPNRRYKIEATPQRTAEGELELVLLFLEPLVGEQLTDNQLELDDLRRDLSAKQEEVEQLRLDNEQMNQELQQALEQVQQQPTSQATTTAIEQSQVTQEPAPAADSESTAEQPGEPIDLEPIEKDAVAPVSEETARDDTLE